MASAVDPWSPAIWMPNITAPLADVGSSALHSEHQVLIGEQHDKAVGEPCRLTHGPLCYAVLLASASTRSEPDCPGQPVTGGEAACRPTGRAA
jgi:hypothetical protein